MQFIEQAEEVMGRDWVERLADVIVAGNLFDLEKGPGVVAATSLFHGAGASLDQIVATVPEPSTWAMFISGLGLFFLSPVARRRAQV